MQTTPLYLFWVAAAWVAVAAAVPFRGLPFPGWNRTAVAGQAAHRTGHRNSSHASPLPLADRGISTYRGALDDLCSVYGFVSLGEQYGYLHATCNLDGRNMATAVFTSLDLSRCLGNYDDHLAWGVNGGAFASCTGCVSRWMDPQWLDCSCGTVNLKDEIYVDADGAVACFDQHGTSNPAPY